MTNEFCIDTTVDDTPGTAKNGTYGCISNCGMEIILTGEMPEKFRENRVLWGVEYQGLALL
jgi:hypothetical protein